MLVIFTAISITIRTNAAAAVAAHNRTFNNNRYSCMTAARVVVVVVVGWSNSVGQCVCVNRGQADRCLDQSIGPDRGSTNAAAASRSRNRQEL